MDKIVVDSCVFISIFRGDKILIRNYSKSHGLVIPDAIIASVAIEKKLPLHTLNVKDFSLIPGLKLLLGK